MFILIKSNRGITTVIVGKDILLEGCMKDKSAEAIVEELLTRGILNGKYPAFSKLKPERELALEFGYSRPVVHKAIIRLESKGLLTIIPRQGVRVNDYRETGRLGLLESIYDLYHGGISRALNQSMLAFIQNNLEAMVLLILYGPVENRRDCHETLRKLKFEKSIDVFIWLQNFAFCSGNAIYPMLLNEFKSGILNVSGAVLKHGNPAMFEEKRSAVTELLSEGRILDRESVHQTIQTLFTFIEENWLTEGGNHE